MGLKSSREAIFEFLKVEDKVILNANKYLVDHAIELGQQKNADDQEVAEVQDKYDEVSPYNIVDQLFM